MPDEKPRAEDGAYQFIVEHIDSVPQMEGLLLLWEGRPAAWTPEELAVRLYISPERALEALRGLVRAGVVAAEPGTPGHYVYRAASEQQDELMREVHATYRRELIQISHMIHSKASSAIREFARAFRFKREQDS